MMAADWPSYTHCHSCAVITSSVLRAHGPQTNWLPGYDQHVSSSDTIIEEYLAAWSSQGRLCSQAGLENAPYTCEVHSRHAPQARSSLLEHSMQVLPL